MAYTKTTRLARPGHVAAGSDLILDSVEVVFDTVSGGEVHAIHDLNLRIPDGQFVTVIGRSGCGKSTLLNLVSGLVAPTSGTVTLGEKQVTGPGRDRGLVFQSDAVFPWKRVADNLDFALRLGGIQRADRPKLVAEYLGLVGLSGTDRLFPKELSGGMRKRLAIAMVLANKPTMLLMDEPFGPLDYATKVELQLEVESLRRTRPLTTMFVTHDVEEAVFLADRVIVMAAGRVVNDVMVDIPRPRGIESRKSPQFAKITAALLDEIMSL